MRRSEYYMVTWEESSAVCAPAGRGMQPIQHLHEMKICEGKFGARRFITWLHHDSKKAVRFIRVFALDGPVNVMDASVTRGLPEDPRVSEARELVAEMEPLERVKLFVQLGEVFCEGCGQEEMWCECTLQPRAIDVDPDEEEEIPF